MPARSQSAKTDLIAFVSHTCTDLCACNKCENSLDVEDKEEIFEEIDEAQESDEESWSDATEDDETDFENYV